MRRGQDTEITSMFYPKKTFLLGAKKIRNYFKDILKTEKAIVYGFRVPKKDAVNRSYFDELLMHGIIQPGESDSHNNPYYTDRNRRQDCQKTIFLIFIYKKTRNPVYINLKDADISVDADDYALIKNIFNRYNCQIVKEFYNSNLDTKIMTVIKGTLK